MFNKVWHYLSLLGNNPFVYLFYSTFTVSKTESHSLTLILERRGENLRPLQTLVLLIFRVAAGQRKGRALPYQCSSYGSFPNS